MSELRLRRGREVCGLTLGQASRLFGIPVVRLSEAALGRVTLELSELSAVAAVYQTSVSWLLGDEPAIPAETGRLLRSHEVSTHDRDIILETVGMWSTPDGS